MGHRWLMGLVGVVVIIALWSGSGGGTALALALFGCLLTIVLMVWLMMSSMSDFGDVPSAVRSDRQHLDCD